MPALPSEDTAFIQETDNILGESPFHMSLRFWEALQLIARIEAHYGFLGVRCLRRDWAKNQTFTAEDLFPDVLRTYRCCIEISHIRESIPMVQGEL